MAIHYSRSLRDSAGSIQPQALPVEMRLIPFRLRNVQHVLNRLQIFSTIDTERMDRNSSRRLSRVRYVSRERHTIINLRNLSRSFKISSKIVHKNSFWSLKNEILVENASTNESKLHIVITVIAFLILSRFCCEAFKEIKGDSSSQC